MFNLDLEIPDIEALKQQYAPVAHYILDKIIKKYYYIVNLEEYDALVIAYYLDKKEKYSVQEILSGAHDIIITGYINHLDKTKSYLKPGEEKKTTPLIVVKKETAVKIISLGLAAVTLTSGFVALAKNKHQKSINEQTDKYFTELVSDENDKGNIVMQNAVYDADNNEVTLEVDNKVAQDIADICNQNPNLIDIALFNAFQSYEEDKLYHMDNVLNNLKVLLDKENSSYKRISNCYTFLDYLIKIRALPDDHIFYDQIKKIIDVYRELKKGGIYNPVGLLGERQGRLLDKMLDNYDKMAYSINDAHFEELQEMYENGGRK